MGLASGFAGILVVILLGVLVTHVGLVDAAGQRTLVRLSFYVASPALLLSLMSEADVGEVVGGRLAAVAVGVVAVMAAYVGVGLVRHDEPMRMVVGSLSASYVNAGNLGLPLATVVLDDSAAIAPTLILQLVVLQPLALAALDAATSGRRPSLRAILSRAARNPLTLAAAAGVLLSLTGTSLPRLALVPVDLVAGMSVPAMLLAYGASLRLGPLPGRGVPVGELGFVVLLKMVVQPAATYLAGRFAFGLDSAGLAAVVLVAALPTAQNVYIIASRYRAEEVLARDAVFVTTLAWMPVALLTAALTRPGS